MRERNTYGGIQTKDDSFKVNLKKKLTLALTWTILLKFTKLNLTCYTCVFLEEVKKLILQPLYKMR